MEEVFLLSENYAFSDFLNLRMPKTDPATSATVTNPSIGTAGSSFTSSGNSSCAEAMVVDRIKNRDAKNRVLLRLWEILFIDSYFTINFLVAS
ncbi:hypothetical protein D3C80_1560450 [compost metagenome]